MSDSVSTGQGISRRTVTKSAAWSVPVIAAAVSAPLAAASVVQTFDVGVTGSCVGGVTLLGLTAFGDPTWTISAVSGTIPAGTTFTLTSTSLLDLGVLSSSQTLDVSLLDGNTVLITVLSDMAQGTSATVSIPVGDSVLDASLLGTYTLAFQSAPAGYEETGTAANSDSVSNVASTSGLLDVSVCTA